MHSIGADAGSFCTDSGGPASDLATTVITDATPVALAECAREISPVEFARVLRAEQTVVDCDVLSADRRDRLLLYREFLPAIGVKTHVIRCWQDRGSHHWVTLARSGPCDQRRFLVRAATMIDAAFPVLALGARAVTLATEGATVRDAGISNVFGFSIGEARVVALLERGLTNREISALLGISFNTVRNQIASAFRRAGASTRSELVYLLRSGRSI